ncbi:MAG: pyridoxamine 5-phosphate oxidase [Gemmobacter sp.]
MPSDPVSRDTTLPPDAEARALARALLHEARHAALSYLDAATGLPGISRIAFGTDPAGLPTTFVSALAPHAPGLRTHPDCAVMVGDPGSKGDPLNAPRLMLRARAGFVGPADSDHAALRAKWLYDHPKSKLYIDFADFAFVRLTPVSVLLNGGFARAYRLTIDDLGL